MNYNEAIAYMKKIEKYGSVPGLDSIKELLRRLGNPQKDYPVVQIAGTNGKGSTGAFLTTILIEAGCKVGRFFSPAVFCQRETISYEGEMISEDDFASCMEQVAYHADAMEAEGIPHPTVFEVETALAYVFFSKYKCELAVVECGMGGALDATNVTDTNLLSILTSISMDHMAFLGNSLEEIATQKAGIIKPGRPVVSARQDAQVEEVIENYCRDMDAQLYYVSSYIVEDLEVSLKGAFQKENAALAVMAANLLQREGYPIKEEAIKAGLQNTVWKGRFQKISDKPDIWLDGAHNPKGALCLKEAFKEIYGDRKAQVIMGIFKDKEAKQLCEIMKPHMQQLYTVTPPGPRGLPAEELKEIAESFDILATACETVDDALEKAIDQADEDGVVLAFGSLSYLSQVEAFFHK